MSALTANSMPRVGDVMTPDPAVLEANLSLVHAARQMRSEDIGDVLVREDDQFRGIVTDRDIVVRAVAEGLDPHTATLGDVCSGDLVTVEPGTSQELAVDLMREHGLRRLPVVESGRVVGIVTIGDLAVERDPDSALADISEAPPNR